MRSALAFGLACTLIAVGCGGGSPTSPSMMTGMPGTPGTPGATPGATITGSVTNASGPAALPTASRPYEVGLMVHVVGTNISVAVGPNGQFVLQGVPAGDVQLRFTGDGCDAVLTLSGLKTGDTIQIKVTVRGTMATLDDDSRDGDDGEQVVLNGTVSELTRSGSAFSFRIGSQLVNGDATTEFFGDGNRSESVESLANGLRVEVKGEMRGGQLFALRIHINRNAVPQPEVELEGTISVLTPACPSVAFNLVVGGGQPAQPVVTSAATSYLAGLSCGSLKNGDKVRVKGSMQTDGRLFALQIKR